MAIPNVSGALRGWTLKRNIRIVTKAIVNHIMQQTAEIVVMDIMVQPLQPEKIRRKPEEQRSWKWYSILTKKANRLLKVDDIVTVNAISYRIDSIQPWDEAGYRRYEATQDYTGVSPMYALAYSGNGAISGTAPATIAYQEGAKPMAAANPFARTGFIFTGWNTAVNGSGTAYAVGAAITIGVTDITLYAQWGTVST